METTVEMVLSEKDFRMISDRVYKHCGINLHEGKKELVRARIAKRLRVGKFNTFTEYMSHVNADKSGREFEILIDSLSTNLTSFFRESNHFHYLNTAFFPDLLKAKATRNNKSLRVWSAGCSSGEEPYTLAITLLEATQGLGNWDIKILATDISTKVLDMAKRGVYKKKRIEPMTTAQKQRYLTGTNEKIDGEPAFQVTNELKQLVRFRHLNLMKPWPFGGPFDFIFCRNVMIYFDKPTQEGLVNRYWTCLDDGGLLFTGHSESLTGIQHKFKYVQPTIYKKP